MTRDQLHGAAICGLIVLAVVVIVLVGCAVAAVLAAAAVERRQQAEQFSPDTEHAIVQALRTVGDEPVNAEHLGRAVAAFNAGHDELAARRWLTEIRNAKRAAKEASP